MSWINKARMPRVTGIELQKLNLKSYRKREASMSWFERCCRFVTTGVWRRSFEIANGGIKAYPPYHHPFRALIWTAIMVLQFLTIVSLFIGFFVWRYL